MPLLAYVAARRRDLSKLGPYHATVASEFGMHHKRKRPKSARAGCLLCKPHKANGCCADHKNMRMGDLRRYQAGTSQIRCEPDE